MVKALFLDFYGTLVEEDDRYIEEISERIAKNSALAANPNEISVYWWRQFSSMCLESYGLNFTTQRELETLSLKNTIEHFHSVENAFSLGDILFEYWRKPKPFNDSFEFLNRIKIPVYIISNIDRNDLKSAVEFCGFPVTGCFTSEDARSYKPRTEIFKMALARLGIRRDEVYHIGDSLSSDIDGANAAGIRVVWLNRKRRKVPENRQPYGICHNLLEAFYILDLL